MNGFFVYNKTIDKARPSGIDKKVILMVEQLNSDSDHCDLVELSNNHCSKIRKGIAFLCSRMIMGKGFPCWYWSEKYQNADYIYFRRPDAVSKDLIEFLKRVKENNPSTKIVMEIPNYPYDEELGIKLINKPLVIKDRFFRNRLKGLVDRIAIQSNVDELFGIKTIQFTNGIAIDQISIKEPNNSPSQTINLCAVASLESWQGYERLINGFHEYYSHGGQRDVQLTIAGSGSEQEYYCRLVDKFHLSNRIHFLGRIQGTQLEALYNNSDIAVDAFGRYKSGNTLSTSLKSREYLAKGLPIITGCTTDVLKPEFKYFLEFPNDNTNIDLAKVIAFYDEIYGLENVNDIINNIRNYAKHTCDVSTMMDPIIRYLKNE